MYKMGFYNKEWVLYVLNNYYIDSVIDIIYKGLVIVI